MTSIDETVKQLKQGDIVRIEWKPFVRIYKRDTFIGKYLNHNERSKTLTVKRDWLDAFDIKCESVRTMPYDRIESLELLEPRKLGD